MLSFGRCFFILAAALVLNLVPAVAGGQDDARQLALRVLTRQHLDQGILQWKEMLNSAPAPTCGCGAAAQAKIADNWRRSVDGAFGRLDFLDEIVETYVRTFTAAELAALDKFSMSPLGTAIFEAENPRRANELTARLAAMEPKAVQRALDAEPERKRLLQDLLAASGGIDVQVDTMMSVALAVNIGAAAVLPKGGPRPDTAEVQALVEAGRAAYRATLDAVALPYIYLTYKDLSTAQLRQYAAFLKSPLGVRNQKLLNASVRAVLTARAIDIGGRFTKAMIGVDL